MVLRKFLITGILSVSIAIGSASISFAQNMIHTVQPGDTFWKISQKYGVNIYNLMDANGANQNTVLYVGQKITVPSEAVHIVQPGDKYWIISEKYNVDILQLMAYNGHNENTILYIGQKIKIPQMQKPSNPANSSSQKPYITYEKYSIRKGDYFWDIAMKHGIPMDELLKANNMTESTVLYEGDVIKIPVHHIPIKQTAGEKYGEYLDWWSEAQYVIPSGSVFELVDFYTGKSFMAKRTTGANHADVETMTAADTAKMKAIWGGSFSWERRPVIIKYNGRKLAASATAMPHAGNDAAAGGKHTSWRSGDYGAGYNYDWVKNNGMDGVFDIHFPNSSRHSDGKVDEKHQANIRIAAGLK
ncbi:MAG: LysM peptidoglycan-binding domain-containing protein [Acetivibrionales bacterium]|jgi:LysM repeat protein